MRSLNFGAVSSGTGCTQLRVFARSVRNPRAKTQTTHFVAETPMGAKLDFAQTKHDRPATFPRRWHVADTKGHNFVAHRTEWKSGLRRFGALGAVRDRHSVVWAGWHLLSLSLIAPTTLHTHPHELLTHKLSHLISDTYLSDSVTWSRTGDPSTPAPDGGHVLLEFHLTPKIVTGDSNQRCCRLFLRQSCCLITSLALNRSSSVLESTQDGRRERLLCCPLSEPYRCPRAGLGAKALWECLFHRPPAGGTE